MLMRQLHDPQLPYGLKESKAWVAIVLDANLGIERALNPEEPDTYVFALKDKSWLYTTPELNSIGLDKILMHAYVNLKETEAGLITKFLKEEPQLLSKFKEIVEFEINQVITDTGAGIVGRPKFELVNTVVSFVFPKWKVAHMIEDSVINLRAGSQQNFYLGAGLPHYLDTAEYKEKK